MFNFSAFISYVFVVTFTAGPNNIMSMANGSKHGFKKALQFNLGVSTGFFVIMTLCSYFNLMLFNVMPKIKMLMGILGAIYMIYLAVTIIKSKEKVQKQDDAENMAEEDEIRPFSKNIKNPDLFFTGLTMQFINPKVILYGITVISSFIIPFYKSNISLIIFSIFLALVGFMATSCWALFGSLFNKLLLKHNRQFNIIMGLLLIYSALSISGITSLLNR